MITIVTFSLDVDADVSSFDELAFRDSLASLLPRVEPTDITLNVTAGSLRVGVRVRAQTEIAGAAVLDSVSNFDITSLSTALGVTVTRITAPAVEVGSVAAPSPPPPLQPSPSPTPPSPPAIPGLDALEQSQSAADDDTSLSAGLVTAGISIILAIICGVASITRARRMRHAKRTNTNGVQGAEWVVVQMQTLHTTSTSTQQVL